MAKARVVADKVIYAGTEYFKGEEFIISDHLVKSGQIVTVVLEIIEGPEGYIFNEEKKVWVPAQIDSEVSNKKRKI